jgi:hypothetical protein
MPKAKHDSDVKAAFATLFDEAFYTLMTAMVRSEPYAAEYAGFSEAVRKLTDEQHHLISKYAAEYCVEHLNPSPSKWTQKRIARVKRQAVAHALDRLANEAAQ